MIQPSSYIHNPPRDSDHSSPKRRQTAQTTNESFFKKQQYADSGERTNPKRSPSGRQQVEEEAGVIIEATSSDQSAFAFLASQDTNNLLMPGGSGSANYAQIESPEPFRKTSKNSFISSASQQTMGPSKTFDDSSKNGVDDSPLAVVDENETGDFGIKFEIDAKGFKYERPRQLKEVNRAKFQTLLRECKEAFLISDASALMESVLVQTALIGGALSSPLSGRMALGSFLIFGSAGIPPQAEPSSLILRAQRAAPENSKTVLGTFGLSEWLQVDSIRVLGFALLPQISPMLSAVYAGYLSVHKMAHGKGESLTQGMLSAILLLRLMSDAIFPLREEEHQWIQNILAVLLIVATWMAAAKHSTVGQLSIADLSSEASQLRGEVSRLEENQRCLLTDNKEAMIVCQINKQQHSPRGVQITKVLLINKGFHSLFSSMSLPSAFSKRLCEPVSATEPTKRCSLQVAIQKAFARENALYKVYLPGSDEVAYVNLDVAPIRFNSHDAHLVKIQHVGPAIHLQSLKMQAVFQEALISTIQHEQLNPLNSIINLSSLMYDQFAENIKYLRDNAEASPPDFGSAVELEEAEQTLEWIKIIRSSSIMMQLLNAAILNQGQIDSGKFQPTYDIVKDPLEIATKLTDLFQEQAKSQQLTVHVYPTLAGANAARVQVLQRGLQMEVALYEQIIFNILVNAFKFNKPKGIVAVKLRASLVGDEGQTVELLTTISDTGIGMTNEKKGKLGKMFESIRLRESTSILKPKESLQATSGVGLGFSLSQRLTNFLGGFIKVHSELNQGTEVVVGLRFKLGPKSRSAVPPQRKSASSFHSIDILQGSSYQSKSTEDKKESPEIQLSQIAFQFKHRRTQMNSSQNVQPKLSRGTDGSNNLTRKPQFGRLRRAATTSFQDEEIKGEPSLSDRIRESSKQAFEMKREFSFSNKISSQSAGKQQQYNQSSVSAKPKSSTYLTSVQSQLSVSESSSDEESNFGNLTDSHSLEIQIQETLKAQSSFSPVKTKSSLNQLAWVSPEGLYRQANGIGSPFEHQLEPGPHVSAPQSMESLPPVPSRQLSNSSSDSKDDQNAEELNKLAREQSLKRKPLPKLQQIVEDFEEDKSSVLDQYTSRWKMRSELAISRLASSSSDGDSKADVEATLEEDLMEAENKASSKLLTPQNSQKRISRLVELQARISVRKEVQSRSCTASVMLVDDSQFNIATLEVMINVKFSLKCLIAHNGRQAVDLFKQFYVPPSATACPHCEKPGCEFRGIRLVFMDLNMPVMDGFEASEKILAFQGRDRRCTIVALTAFQDPKTRKKCLQIGMKEVLSKPASQQKISETVERYNRTGAKNAQ